MYLRKFLWKVLIPASLCGRDELQQRGPFGEDVTVDGDAAVIAFFAPIIEECRRTGHSTAEMSSGVRAIESRSNFTANWFSWRLEESGRASAERCLSTPPPSDVIWFGVRGGEVLEKKGRKRENKQHKAQTNKPSSEATLLKPLWLYDGGMHGGILGWH